MQTNTCITRNQKLHTTQARKSSYIALVRQIGRILPVVFPGVADEGVVKSHYTHLH